jgi:hypothetical protein
MYLNMAYIEDGFRLSINDLSGVPARGTLNPSFECLTLPYWSTWDLLECTACLPKLQKLTVNAE